MEKHVPSQNYQKFRKDYVHFNYTYLINKQYYKYDVICNGTRIYYVSVFYPVFISTMLYAF